MKDNAFSYFDAIYCINPDSATKRWEEMRRRFEALGIVQRVRRAPVLVTPQSHHIGAALSHRSVVEQACRHGLRNVLVFEDDAIFLDDTLELLNKMEAELSAQDWNLFYLGGGYTIGYSVENVPGCSYLRRICSGVIGIHAIAYNHSIYSTILEEIPGDVEAATAWIAIHNIDVYMLNIDKRFLGRPCVALQPWMLQQEDAELRARYTLGEVFPGDVFRLDGDWQVDRSGEQVILNHRQTGKIALSGTAGLILRLVDGGRTTPEIREILQMAYPKSAAEIGRDIERTLASLVHWGAVTRM